MACGITLNGIDFGCRDSVGGINRIWLADWNTAAPSISQGRYTATMTNDDSDHTPVFKLFRIRVGNGSMESTLASSEANGTTSVTTDLNMKFTKLSEDNRAEIAEILKGNLAAIIETNAGEYYGLGAKHPVTLTAGTVTAGTAMEDFAGYDITIQDYDSTLPYLLDESLIADLPTTVE